MSSLDPVLAELAATHGVATFFHDWVGHERQVSSPAVVSVLAALGVDAGTPEAASRALDDARLARWRRMLPQYLVVRAGSKAQVAVHVPDGAWVEVELELENGGRVALHQLMVWVDPREVDGSLVGVATFEIPDGV
ncbi:MAG TPA: hypothetical protein VGD55_01010, partial [Acidothermaceae bacterium]